MDDMDDVSTMLREAAESYIADGYDPVELQKGAMAPRLIDRARWGELADMGWLGACLPEELGGSGLGLSGATVLAEAFGRKLFPPPFAYAVCMPSEILNGALAAGGDKAGIAEIAGVLVSGRRVVTLAWQEHAGQLDVVHRSMRLVNGKVSGTKLFVHAVEHDGILLVDASALGEPCLVAVAADGPGVTITQAASGIGACATVKFDDAPILQPQPLLSGDKVNAVIRKALAAGRIFLSAQLGGMASGCLEKTLKYVEERVQFNRPIGSFQTIQHRCVDLHIDALMAAATWRNALRLWQEQPGTAAADAAVGAAKARCGEVAMKVARESIQMHGAMGFAEEVGVGPYLRAAMQASSMLGSPLQHRRLFAAAISRTTSGGTHA